MTAVVVAAGLVVMMFLLWLVLRLQRQRGRMEAMTDGAKEDLSALRAAQSARDRLLSDADFASRVRRRFSR